MATDKKEFRARFLTLRKGLSPAQRGRYSAEIFHHIVEQSAWKKAEIILTYISTGTEVETRPIMEEAWNQGKRIAVPLLSQDPSETLISELKSLDDLGPGPLKGIPEPSLNARHLISPNDIDLALIPGVAFDNFGGRLGLGRGYFDRLLPQLTKSVLWGLAYEIQISEDTLPMESHDHPVHAVVTEEELIYPEEVG